MRSSEARQRTHMTNEPAHAYTRLGSQGEDAVEAQVGPGKGSTVGKQTK